MRGDLEKQICCGEMLFLQIDKSTFCKLSFNSLISYRNKWVQNFKFCVAPFAINFLLTNTMYSQKEYSVEVELAFNRGFNLKL